MYYLHRVRALWDGDDTLFNRVRDYIPVNMHEWMNYFKSKWVKFICACNLFKINDLQGRDKLSIDIAKINFILNVKFRKPMMNSSNISIRISSQGFDRELAPLNFPCGLILFYSSPQSGKPTYLLITLLNSCKKCFVYDVIRTRDLRFRKPLLYPTELRGHKTS